MIWCFATAFYIIRRTLVMVFIESVDLWIEAVSWLSACTIVSRHFDWPSFSFKDSVEGTLRRESSLLEPLSVYRSQQRFLLSQVAPNPVRLRQYVNTSQGTKTLWIFFAMLTPRIIVSGKSKSGMLTRDSSSSRDFRRVQFRPRFFPI